MSTPKPTRSRLSKPMAPAVRDYTASVHYDRRLAPHDIAGSMAWARALHNAGALTDKEAELVLMGLTTIRDEVEKGAFQWKADLEDVHMNIEARLVELAGDAGRKLHTGRSRNDQVAVDMRLYVKEACDQTVTRVRALQRALLDQAEAHKDAILPGYTHMQRAQPVLLAHHLLAYVEMLERDASRFRDARARADVLPLGSGALAGTPYAIDRQALAWGLAFSRISRNSMDAVSDRDFVVGYEAAASLAMTHLSRLAEELVLWSGEEFGFVELDDAYATGSSLMPQKKNPDVAELARGKTGRVYGHLMAMLAVLKGLPLTYNRDLQEDKEGLFDTVDTLHATLDVFAGMVGTMHVNAARMRATAEQGYMLATDIADYLVKKDVPFREAHRIVGGLVQHAVAANKGLWELTLEEYRRFSPKFAEDVLSISVESSVRARNVAGGTSQEQVARALADAHKMVESTIPVDSMIPVVPGSRVEILPTDSSADVGAKQMQEISRMLDAFLAHTLAGNPNSNLSEAKELVEKVTAHLERYGNWIKAKELKK